MEFSYQYEYGEKEIEVIKNLIYSQLKKETDYKKPLGFFRLAHVLLGLGYIFLAISYYASSAMEANTFLLVLYLLLGFFGLSSVLALQESYGITARKKPLPACVF